MKLGKYGMIVMELSLNDIYLLQHFHKKKTSYRLNEYQTEQYGEDYLDRLNTLQEAGYIQTTSAWDSLFLLTVAELKNVLRKNGQKISGKKKDLIERIQETIPESDYENIVTKSWCLTGKGINSVKTYFKSNTMNELQRNLSNKDWGLLRNTYLTIGQSLYSDGNYSDALPYFLLVKYFDYSGLENNNSVSMYEDIDWASMTNISYTIEKCLRHLNANLCVLNKYFEKALSMCPPIPFHYFQPETVLEITKKELCGYKFNLSDYRNVANKPSRIAKNYTYIDWNHVDIVHTSIKAQDFSPVDESMANTKEPQTIMENIGYKLGRFIANLFSFHNT